MFQGKHRQRISGLVANSCNPKTKNTDVGRSWDPLLQIQKFADKLVTRRE